MTGIFQVLYMSYLFSSMFCLPAWSLKCAGMFRIWTVCGSFLLLRPKALQQDSVTRGWGLPKFHIQVWWSHKLEHGYRDPCVMMQGLDCRHTRIWRPVQRTCMEWLRRCCHQESQERVAPAQGVGAGPCVIVTMELEVSYTTPWRLSARHLKTLATRLPH